jgi:uncharacterized protein YjbI with pentapeptide repeats
VLCGYLRIASTQLSLEDTSSAQGDLQADREVRHALVRTITAHLREGAAVSWVGKDFDLTGVVFDGGDFSGAIFSGVTVDFSATTFSGGIVQFRGAKFSGVRSTSLSRSSPPERSTSAPSTSGRIHRSSIGGRSATEVRGAGKKRVTGRKRA